MIRPWMIGAIGAIGMPLLLPVAPHSVATGWRAAFLTASAPIFGAVLMLMIARVVVTDWSPLAPLTLALPMILLFGLLILPAQFAAEVPDHLRLWASPWAIALRTLIAIAALWFAAARLRGGASRSFAAVALALWTMLITYIAYDWMLGGDPGHPATAVGMMLTVEQVGGACAALLILGHGETKLRRDLSYLLIAAALGLSYMIFMDYLIKWYADLPSQVDWYLKRDHAMALLAAAGLCFGLFGPILALVFARGEQGRRIAGGSALFGLLLINLWWVAADWIAALAALFGLIWVGFWGQALGARRSGEQAHG